MKRENPLSSKETLELNKPLNSCPRASTDRLSAHYQGSLNSLQHQFSSSTKQIIDIYNRWKWIRQCVWNAWECLRDRVPHRHISLATHIRGEKASFCQQELQPFIHRQGKKNRYHKKSLQVSQKEPPASKAEVRPLDYPYAEGIRKDWELSRIGINLSHAKKAEKLPPFS